MLPLPSNPDEWVLHPAPAWGDKVDFVANTTFDDSGPGSLRFEQLLFEKLRDQRYRLCCIPFFTYGFCLGDVVALADDAEIGLTPGDVLERSDHWSLRVLLAPDGDVAALRDLLTTHCAAVETRGRLVACSVVGRGRLESLRRGLDELERGEHLSYETAWI
ncbi:MULTISPECIES: DUF4265 domain-containing protein [unclassified Curtobacterium]|uniref:DUF4265 domain-containing protein n=1 Tax=unclassified Curtobacterium TaxID=257496 RepID=UPI0008DE63FB|nr:MULTISPECIES: DUF4265 domain-containing protein [unclassified Curtobacterium]WIA98209.1 DUF4265 domain-containing protein [Curtobacterium sp. MCBA15_004]WIB01463.1 DUF4265 domain-containing protein [Curtobacterium sp. MCBA15_012]